MSLVPEKCRRQNLADGHAGVDATFQPAEHEVVGRLQAAGCGSRVQAIGFPYLDLKTPAWGLCSLSGYVSLSKATILFISV